MDNPIIDKLELIVTKTITFIIEILNIINSTITTTI